MGLEKYLAGRRQVIAQKNRTVSYRRPVVGLPRRILRSRIVDFVRDAAIWNHGTTALVRNAKTCDRARDSRVPASHGSMIPFRSPDEASKLPDSIGPMNFRSVCHKFAAGWFGDCVDDAKKRQMQVKSGT